MDMKNNDSSSKVYQIIGTTDDFLQCELCGRDELKSTVALRDQDGNVSHFGSDCAARAAGWTIKETQGMIKAADEAQRAEQQSRFYAESNAHFAEVQAAGGFKAYLAAKRAA